MFDFSGPTHGDAAHRHAATIAAIESALALAEDVDASAITVSMAEGLVMLGGTAPSKDDIERAMNIATAIAGGLVRNRIWRSA